MKHSIIFAGLLAGIIALGMTGSKLAFSFIGRSDKSGDVFRKNTVSTDALFLGDSTDLDFEPMSLVSSNIRVRVTPDSSDQEYVGSCSCYELVLSILKELSLYSEYTGIVSFVGEPVLYTTPSCDQYYIQGAKYLNSAGTEMTAELILNRDLEVLYVRFYEDTSFELTPDETSQGAQQLGKMTDSLFSRNSLDIAPETYGGYPLYDDMISLDTAGSEDTAAKLSAAFSAAGAETDYMSKLSETRSPIENFFLHTSSLCKVTFTVTVPIKDFDGAPTSYEEERTVFSTIALTNMLLFEEEGALKYSSGMVASDGRIYDTLRISNGYYITNIIVIYNVRMDVIEGICTSSESMIW
ncbi:MAG: hypothetical protein IJM44_02795 [Ruminococcus sp.]|nr:hypothetical protein [Ruminococcus sp.]